MAHQLKILRRTLLALASLSCASAMAVNPLGFAVAAAPSMFVLAVAQAAPDSADGKAVKAEEPRVAPREARAADARNGRQAAAQPVPDGPIDDRKFSLR